MKQYGLIGYPLTHSFSKKYFNEKFKNENIEANFENFEINKAEKLLQIIEQDKDIQGVTVTIPHKEAVIPLLDELDKTAQDIKAVNVIKKINNGKLKGYNSDAYGFQKALQKKLQTHHKQALILGTGGASKAISYVLKKLGISFRFVDIPPKASNIMGYEDIDKTIIDTHTLIINATPLGTYPKEETYPNIPYQYLTNKHYLFDLVYNPAKTIFLAKGEQQNAAISNGYKMLVYQAEKAWEIWNNK